MLEALTSAVPVAAKSISACKSAMQTLLTLVAPEEELLINAQPSDLQRGGALLRKFLRMMPRTVKTNL
jgi:hypothetical protein